MGWLSLGKMALEYGWSWVKGEQEKDLKKQALKAQWETAQTEKYPWFVSVIAVAHVVGPIDYVFYLAVKAAQPIESPSDVAEIIHVTFDTLPTWLTGLAVTMLAAMAGISVNGQQKVKESRQRQRERDSEARADRERRNRMREERGEPPADDEEGDVMSDRPGPPRGR